MATITAGEALSLISDGWLGPVRWAEFTSRNDYTQEATFGWEMANACSLSVLVHWADRVEAVKRLLGQNYVAPGPPPKGGSPLIRVPPARHPVHSHLYCDHITGLRPVEFQAKEATGVGSIARYKGAILTCRFTQPQWNRTLSNDKMLEGGFINDDGTIQEYKRYCQIIPRAGNSTLTSVPAAFKYTEGDGLAGAPVANVTEVTLAVPIFVLTADVVAVWRRVPLKGILNEEGVATNMDRCMAKMNDREFMGRAKNTLLFKGYAITLEESPQLPPGLEEFEPPIMCRVELNFSHWDPPAGGVAQGWALQPYTNGKWYKIGYAGDLARTQVPEIDFKQIFSMV